MEKHETMICLTDIAKQKGKRISDWLGSPCQKKDFAALLARHPDLKEDNLIEITQNKKVWGIVPVAMLFDKWCEVGAEGMKKLRNEASGKVVKPKTEIPEGYINLTEMACKSGKDLKDWANRGVGRKAIAMFSSCYPEIERPVIAKKGKGGCTWAHPEIAAMFAAWCDLSYAALLQRFVMTERPKKPFELSDLHPLAEIQFRNALHERVYGYGCMDGQGMTRKQLDRMDYSEILSRLESRQYYRETPLDELIDESARSCVMHGSWDVAISTYRIERYHFFTQAEKEGLSTIVERKIYDLDPVAWIKSATELVSFYYSDRAMQSSKDLLLSNPAKAIGYGRFNVAKELGLQNQIGIPESCNNLSIASNSQNLL